MKLPDKMHILSGLFIFNLPIAITANEIPFYHPGNKTSKCDPTIASNVTSGNKILECDKMQYCHIQATMTSTKQSGLPFI